MIIIAAATLMTNPRWMMLIKSLLYRLVSILVVWVRMGTLPEDKGRKLSGGLLLEATLLSTEIEVSEASILHDSNTISDIIETYIAQLILDKFYCVI